MSKLNLSSFFLDLTVLIEGHICHVTPFRLVLRVIGIHQNFDCKSRQQGHALVRSVWRTRGGEQWWSAEGQLGGSCDSPHLGGREFLLVSDLRM